MRALLAALFFVAILALVAAMAMDVGVAGLGPVSSIGGVELPGDATSAQVDLVVDRNDDQPGLPCTTAVNDCTLRSALDIANQDGRASKITFADHMIITLTSPLPALLEPGTSIVARTDQEVHVNGNNLPGTVLRVAAHDSVLDGLRIYGANGNAVVTVSGQAYSVRIANNLIGDDDQPAELCGRSDLAYAGIFIDANGAMPEGMVGRVYVVNNIIECNRGVPGDGIMILTDGVFIGQDSSGAVSGNTIRHNRGTAVVVQGPGNTVRGNRINANGGALAVTTFDNNAILENEIASP